jgi:hypothetical protein
MDSSRSSQAHLTWAATHATTRALESLLPILTVSPDRYDGVVVDVLSL